ncbi:MAG: hypothetical protein ABJJ53_09790 [Sulfitobacter sp.]
MAVTFRPPITEFATASGDNVDTNGEQSLFDFPPKSIRELTISAQANDSNPTVFETGDTYDLSWGGDLAGRLQNAVVLRSDYIESDVGVVVFEGTNATTGEVVQVVWSPGFDLENWLGVNGDMGARSIGFHTTNLHNPEFGFVRHAADARIRSPAPQAPVERLMARELVQSS